MRQCQQRTIIQWKGVSRKLIKHHRRAHSSLGTIDDSPLGWEESEATGPPRPWPQVITTSTKLVAGFKETVFLPMYIGFSGKKRSQTLAPGTDPRPWSQTVTGSAEHDPGFAKELCPFSIHQSLRVSLDSSGPQQLWRPLVTLGRTIYQTEHSLP